MNTKIEHEEHFSEKELLMISLFCFMKSARNVEDNILDSTELITHIPGLNKDLAQFSKVFKLQVICPRILDNNCRISKFEVTFYFIF